MSVLKWPRGKYNGKRIVGFEVKFELDVTWWKFFLPSKYNSAFGFGPFCWRWNCNYSCFDGDTK